MIEKKRNAYAEWETPPKESVSDSLVRLSEGERITSGFGQPGFMIGNHK